MKKAAQLCRKSVETPFRKLIVNQQVDTLPKVLRWNCDKWGDRSIALRHKRRGIWRECSWKDYYEKVKSLALGLKNLGFRPGEKLCIIGDNEPAWYYAQLAAQALRGVAVGVFPDSSQEEIEHIVSDSEAAFVCVRGQEEIDKILQAREGLPMLRKAIYWDPKGVTHCDASFVISVDEVQKLGMEYEKENQDLFDQEIACGRGEDIAILSYSSGTTRSPKGCMFTHSNLLVTATEWLKISSWRPVDNYVSVVSPAWIMEQYAGITAGLISGATVNFPEAPDTAVGDLREISPSIVLFDFRMWENLHASIHTRIESGSSIRHWMLATGVAVARESIDERNDRGSKGLRNLLRILADLTVFRPLKDKIGLLHTRSAYTGGGYASPSTVEFFRTIGVPLKQLYGSCETGLCCCHYDVNDLPPETIGLPLPGIEMKLNREGEMMWRGHSIFAGYHKDPDLTREVLVEGWYRQRESAYRREDGQIVYLGRLSDVINGESNEKYTCQAVEAALRSNPFVKEAIAVAGGFPRHVVCLIQIDFTSVGKWAESHGLDYTTVTELSQKTEVLDLIQEEIKAVNLNFPERGKVRKLVSLPTELTPENGGLTRDGKVRKVILVEKYHDLLDAIFAGQKYFELKSVTPYGRGEKAEASTIVHIRILT